MSSQRKIALKAATGLATVICSLQAATAFAASDPSDPFALPKQPPGAKPADNQDAFSSPAHTGDEPLFAEVRVNGTTLKRLVKLRRQGDTLSIATDSAIYAGLIAEPPAHEYDGQSYLVLSKIAGVSFTFDALHSRLDIQKRRKSDGPNMIDLRPSFAKAENSARAVPAFMVDYDATTTVDKQGVSAAGIVNARLVRGNLSMDSSWALSTEAANGNKNVRRLDTSFTYYRADKMLRVTAGDFISVAPTANRAVRMGGLQISRDFSLRPDLVTYPLPDISGDVAVPTGIDLFVNDRRLTRNDVEQGEFTVRNVPVSLGRNQIGVVIRDALGRETVQSVSLYSSTSLLAPNLSSWSINVGRIRRNYGRQHDSYGALAASGFYRRGITSSLTGEFAGEWRSGFMNLGGGTSMTLGAIGLINAEFRASRRDMPIGDRRGHMFGLSLESVGSRFSLRLNAKKVSDGYDDLASASGDAPPSSLYSAEFGFDLKKLGSFRLAAVEQHRQNWRLNEGQSRRDRMISASYRNNFKGGLNFFADVTHRRADDGYKVTTALFGLTMQFGKQAFGQMSVSVQGNRDQTELSYYQPDIVPGDVGYTVQAGAGVVERLAGSASYRSQWGRLHGQAEIYNGNAAARVSARGAVVLAEGALHASERSSGGVLIVDTNGIDGVPITRENRDAGRTSKDGTLLLTDFTPYVPAKIAIDPNKLNKDILARKLEMMVKLPPRSVAKLTLDVSRYVPERFILKDRNGFTLEPGIAARAYPSGSDYMVGFDGLVEINAALKDEELRIELADGSICHADLTAIWREPGNLIGKLQCQSSLRTVPLIAAKPSRQTSPNTADAALPASPAPGRNPAPAPVAATP